MDDFEYTDVDNILVKMDSDEEKPEEKALDIPEQVMDQIRLVSIYKGISVPSVLFDSTGTKKLLLLQAISQKESNRAGFLLWTNWTVVFTLN